MSLMSATEAAHAAQSAASAIVCLACCMVLPAQCRALIAAAVRNHAHNRVHHPEQEIHPSATVFTDSPSDLMAPCLTLPQQTHVAGATRP